MAQISNSISITNFRDIQSQLNGVADAIFRQFLVQALEGTEANIKTIFIDLFRETDVYLGLVGRKAGDPQYDLQAILGLTPDYGEDLVDNMGNLLEEAITINKPILRNNGRFASRANASTINFKVEIAGIQEQLIDGPFSTYTSVNDFEIPWLEWLLKGGEVADYQILFGPNGKGTSISGRAIMISAEGFNWESSDFQGMREGLNIVEEILQSAEFFDRLTAFFDQRFESESRNFSGTF